MLKSKLGEAKALEVREEEVNKKYRDFRKKVHIFFSDREDKIYPLPGEGWGKSLDTMTEKLTELICRFDLIIDLLIKRRIRLGLASELIKEVMGKPSAEPTIIQELAEKAAAGLEILNSHYDQELKVLKELKSLLNTWLHLEERGGARTLKNEDWEQGSTASTILDGSMIQKIARPIRNLFSLSSQSSMGEEIYLSLPDFSTKGSGHFRQDDVSGFDEGALDHNWRLWKESAEKNCSPKESFKDLLGKNFCKLIPRFTSEKDLDKKNIQILEKRLALFVELMGIIAEVYVQPELGEGLVVNANCKLEKHSKEDEVKGPEKVVQEPRALQYSELYINKFYRSE